MTLDDTRSAADIPEPGPLATHGPARVIAMVNQKGGVGKTTSTVSLGAALAGYGRRVLLVDFDPQGAIAISFGVNPSARERTVYNLLTDQDCPIDDVILHSITADRAYVAAFSTGEAAAWSTAAGLSANCTAEKDVLIGHLRKIGRRVGVSVPPQAGTWP